jgi:hypothetical protein
MRYEEAIAALAEADNWHKSTFSGGENSGCVEVASIPGFVGVRDTKLGATSPILAFTNAEWEAFVQGAREGAFDL